MRFHVGTDVCVKCKSMMTHIVEVNQGIYNWTESVLACDCGYFRGVEVPVSGFYKRD